MIYLLFDIPCSAGSSHALIDAIASKAAVIIASYFDGYNGHVAGETEPQRVGGRSPRGPVAERAI
jgi:hypothetical protein